MTNMPSSSSIVDNRDSILLMQKPGKTPTCCGKKVSHCTCLSASTLFAIATLIGAILLTLGIFGMLGYCAPAGECSALLQQIHEMSHMVATALGSDLFTLSIFALSFGGAATVGGAIGYCIEKCGTRQPKTT